MLGRLVGYPALGKGRIVPLAETALRHSGLRLSVAPEQQIFDLPAPVYAISQFLSVCDLHVLSSLFRWAEFVDDADPTEAPSSQTRILLRRRLTYSHHHQVQA